MSVEERTRVEDALRRIDELVAGLGHGADPSAREGARELVRLILDVHGLALARIMALAASAENGSALVDRLAQDEQVKALLLLYGLHPDDPETRLRRALAALKPRLAPAGVAIEVAQANGGAASVRVVGNAGGLRQEIEAALVDAAPDLDEIAIEWLDGGHVAAAAAAE